MAKRSFEEQERQVSSNLFVSFSKRRRGLFQKASELCTKCNAQIAIVVLSPTGNPFAFGHSSVDEVLHQYYLGQTTINKPSLLTDEHKHQTQRIEGLKCSLKQGQNKENLDEENRVLMDLKEWIEREFEERKTLEELEFLKQKFLVLLEKITKRLVTTSSSWERGIHVVDNDGLGSSSGEFTNCGVENLHGGVAGVGSNLEFPVQFGPFNDMSYGGVTGVGSNLEFPVQCGPFNDMSYGGVTGVGSNLELPGQFSSFNDLSYNGVTGVGYNLEFHGQFDDFNMSYGGVTGVGPKLEFHHGQLDPFMDMSNRDPDFFLSSFWP